MKALLVKGLLYLAQLVIADVIRKKVAVEEGVLPAEKDADAAVKTLADIRSRIG